MIFDWLQADQKLPIDEGFFFWKNIDEAFASLPLKSFHNHTFTVSSQYPLD